MARNIHKYLNFEIWRYFFIDRALLLLGLPLTLLEKFLLKKYAAQPLKHAPVFIIGAPRTGSTFLYQCITNTYNVIYIDNLATLFFRNLFTGVWLSQLFFNHRAHNCYQSVLGDTKSFGLRAPSECGQFWYRWLPKSKHFIDHNDITDDMVNEIRTEITRVANCFNRPVIINNNNIALRIRLISKTFPEARYIVADRAPLYVAQSLLQARITANGSKLVWWSIMPPNYNKIIKKDAYEQVVLQHYHINKQMYADLNALVPKENVLVVDYDKFCSSVDTMLDEIGSFIHYSAKREHFTPPKISLRKAETILPTEKEKLEAAISSLNWNDYSSPA